MARVMFVSTNYIGLTLLPYAPAIFTALLKESGHEVVLFDTSLYPELSQADYNDQREKQGFTQSFDSSVVNTVNRADIKTAKEDLDDLINRFSPNVIMISLTEPMYNQVAQVLKYISEYHIITILGGVFPTFAPELLLCHPGVDIVCVGEGETAVLELCNRLDKGVDYIGIDNLYAKDRHGNVVKVPLSELVDINSIPVPDFSLFQESKFYRPMAGNALKTIPVETNRGCQYKCSFCNSPAKSLQHLNSNGAAKYFRKKCIKKIYDELSSIIARYDPEFIQFFSDNFLAYSNSEFDEFIEMYSSIKLPFYMNTRVETITEDKISRLRDVGLYRMSIGIEHGNEAFRNKVLNKHTTNESITKAVEIIHSVNLPAGLSVNNMIGFPLETRELAMDTVCFNHSISKYIESANAFIFTPFHGTELRKLAVDMGYMDNNTIASGSIFDESILNMPQFPKEEISGISKVFTLYTRFPKSRWSEIKQAEENTPEGNAAFEKIMQEYKESLNER